METRNEMVINDKFKLLSSNEIKTISLICMFIQHAMYAGLWTYVNIVDTFS